MDDSNHKGPTKEKSSPFSPEDEYFLEIESRFAELRQTPFVFSSRDWSLMKSWRDDGIPLAVVLEAMESCFEARARAPRPRTISSLSYCRHAVKELWNERRNLHVGASTDTPETNAPEQLKQLRDVLLETTNACSDIAIRVAIQAAADAIAAIAANESVPRIETRLLAIEEELFGRLERALPESRRNELAKEIDHELSKHRFRDDEIRDRTRKANLRRAIRGDFSIPRLSLFG